MTFLIIFTVFFNTSFELFPYYGKNFFKTEEKGILLNFGNFSIIGNDLLDFRTSFNILYLKKEKSSIFENFFIPYSKSLYPETRKIFKDTLNNLFLWVKEISFNLKIKDLNFSAGRIPISWELLNIYSLFSFFNPSLPFTPSSVSRAGVDGFLFKFEKDFNYLEYGIFPQKNDTLHSAFRIHLSRTGDKELFLLFEEPYKRGIGIIFSFLSGITRFEFLYDKKFNFGIGYDYFLFSKIYTNIEFIYTDYPLKQKILSLIISRTGFNKSVSFIFSNDFENKIFSIFGAFSYSLKDNMEINFSAFYYKTNNLLYLDNKVWLVFTGLKLYF